MTPEERRKLAEHIAMMAGKGIMVEPAYDREEWRRQVEAGEIPPPKAPRARRQAPKTAPDARPVRKRRTA